MATAIPRVVNFSLKFGVLTLWFNSVLCSFPCPFPIFTVITYRIIVCVFCFFYFHERVLWYIILIRLHGIYGVDLIIKLFVKQDRPNDLVLSSFYKDYTQRSVRGIVRNPSKNWPHFINNITYFIVEYLWIINRLHLDSERSEWCGFFFLFVNTFCIALWCDF